MPHLAGSAEGCHLSWPNLSGLVLLTDLLSTDYITGNFLNVLHIITHVVWYKYYYSHYFTFEKNYI